MLAIVGAGCRIWCLVARIEFLAGQKLGARSILYGHHGWAWFIPRIKFWRLLIICGWYLLTMGVNCTFSAACEVLNLLTCHGIALIWRSLQSEPSLPILLLHRTLALIQCRGADVDTIVMLCRRFSQITRLVARACHQVYLWICLLVWFTTRQIALQVDLTGDQSCWLHLVLMVLESWGPHRGQMRLGQRIHIFWVQFQGRRRRRWYLMQRGLVQGICLGYATVRGILSRG